jgi:hypothetical protein
MKINSLNHGEHGEHGEGKPEPIEMGGSAPFLALAGNFCFLAFSVFSVFSVVQSFSAWHALPTGPAWRVQQ